MKKIEVSSYNKAIKYLVLGSKIINLEGHYDKRDSVYSCKVLELEVPNPAFFETLYRDEFGARIYLTKFVQNYLGEEKTVFEVEFILDQY